LGKKETGNYIRRTGMLFKKYRLFLNNLRYKAELAKGNKAYLINAVADVSLLEKIIKECNRDPELKVRIFLIDGTELRIETSEKAQNKTINWERT
jgi:hypothetical protein